MPLRSAAYARTVPYMSERTTDYPGRIWVAYAPDAAAGYELDGLGDWRLIGVVVYGPTTEKLRGTRLRDLEESGGMSAGVMKQDAPPTPEQVAQARLSEQWDAERKAAKAEARRAWVRDVTKPEDLTRHDGEDPDEFYRRIARAHVALSEATDRPTQELARRAGVPYGTAAAWVSRARARGLLDEEGQQS